jgi:hypothetical protein
MKTSAPIPISTFFIARISSLPGYYDFNGGGALELDPVIDSCVRCSVRSSRTITPATDFQYRTIQQRVRHDVSLTSWNR